MKISVPLGCAAEAMNLVKEWLSLLHRYVRFTLFRGMHLHAVGTANSRFMFSLLLNGETVGMTFYC